MNSSGVLVSRVSPALRLSRKPVISLRPLIVAAQPTRPAIGSIETNVVEIPEMLPRSKCAPVNIET
jgi:hypothetical protein